METIIFIWTFLVNLPPPQQAVVPVIVPIFLTILWKISVFCVSFIKEMIKRFVEFLINGWYYNQHMKESEEQYRNNLEKIENKYSSEISDIRKEVKNQTSYLEDRVNAMKLLMDKHLIGLTDDEKREKFRNIIINSEEKFLHLIYNAQTTGNFRAMKGELVSYTEYGMAGKPSQWASQKQQETASLDPVLTEIEFRTLVKDRLLELNRTYYEPIFNKE